MTQEQNRLRETIAEWFEENEIGPGKLAARAVLILIGGAGAILLFVVLLAFTGPFAVLLIYPCGWIIDKVADFLGINQLVSKVFS